jgi:hypothetical protein
VEFCKHKKTDSALAILKIFDQKQCSRIKSEIDNRRKDVCPKQIPGLASMDDVYGVIDISIFILLKRTLLER